MCLLVCVYDDVQFSLIHMYTVPASITTGGEPCSDYLQVVHYSQIIRAGFAPCDYCILYYCGGRLFRLLVLYTCIITHVVALAARLPSHADVIYADVIRLCNFAS